MKYICDFIIPVGNVGGSDFDDRVISVQKIIDSFPKDVHIIIVEQITKNELVTFEVILEENDHVTYIPVEYPTFNKPWLYNIGSKNCKTNHLLLGETDCTPENPKIYFEKLIKQMVRYNINWSFGWNRILYFNSDYTEILRDDKPIKGYAEGGIVYFNLDYYWLIGGSNEWIKELGGIDNELIRRAETDGAYRAFDWTIHHHYHDKCIMKNGIYQQDNREIFIYVQSYPRRSTALLSEFKNKMGSLDKPICDEVEWDDVTDSNV